MNSPVKKSLLKKSRKSQSRKSHGKVKKKFLTMKGDGGILIKRVMGTHKTGKQSIRSHPMAIGLIGVYSSNTFMIFSRDWCRVMSVDSYAIHFFCADPCRGNVPLK